MKINRQQRIADLIRTEVAMLLVRGLRDPRLPPITVTEVEVTRDFKLARIFVTVIGEEADRKVALSELENSKRYIRQVLRDNLSLKFIPHLEFHYDDTYDRGARIDELLKKVKT